MKTSFRIWLAVVLTSFIIVATYSTATSQNFKLAQTSVSKAIPVTKSIMVEGVPFTVKVLSTGNHYIDRTSKDGRSYKQYLGYKTSLIFNDENHLDAPIYSNKEGTSFWILGLTKNGTLKKLKLEA